MRISINNYLLTELLCLSQFTRSKHHPVSHSGFIALVREVYLCFSTGLGGRCRPATGTGCKCQKCTALIPRQLRLGPRELELGKKRNSLFLSPLHLGLPKCQHVDINKASPAMGPGELVNGELETVRK